MSTPFVVIISEHCDDCFKLLRAEIDKAHLLEEMRLVCVGCFEKREAGTQDWWKMRSMEARGRHAHTPGVVSRLPMRAADHPWVTPKPNS